MSSVHYFLGGLAFLAIYSSGETKGLAQNPPAAQQFSQEIAIAHPKLPGNDGVGSQLLDRAADGSIRVFASGQWFGPTGDAWSALPGLACTSDAEFVLADTGGGKMALQLNWKEVIQVERRAGKVWVATARDPFLVENGRAKSLGWPSRFVVRQIAADSRGTLYVASAAGLFEQRSDGWGRVEARDGMGRQWGAEEVLGVAVSGSDELWFGVKAGVGRRNQEAWKFYEGKDGVPWSEFTGITTGSDGAVWLGTSVGAIRFENGSWHYRQGPRWLPGDQVRQVLCDGKGAAWFLTSGGVGQISRTPMKLADKAVYFESEIEKYIKRTPFGYVAEVGLQKPGDRSTFRHHDSDNDGLWTAMYGAGECFAYGATKDSAALKRAKQAFEALRFLQTITQGGNPSPPPGYIARTIRPVEWPDPNAGRLEQDREASKQDALWKVYEPRWPKSADGKWYWKSDTSSDELDGHYFFYALYHEFCAGDAQEKERVRDVVRGITDHLIAHDFSLVDHDGKPTRWGSYGPKWLNQDPRWWPERGLNSLSILSYLAVAAAITGDAKYEAASRELIDKHGYAHNAMYPKVQHGPGSGNQSDDEMAFMCFYTLLRYSKDEQLKNLISYSFYRYWLNEAGERNPFFNFCYAAHNQGRALEGLWGRVDLTPRGGWLEDSLGCLSGFPLDRIDWPHRNSHRLDLVRLRRPQTRDVDDEESNGRGYRVDGKVLPIENRHFNHWNTDPWHLDYGGSGHELASGTVFLLPYYMGLYHGYIQKP